MIQAPALLKDLQRLLNVLEDDLRVRIGEDGALGATLEGEWQTARTAGRTGETYAAWLEADITQAAVHWLLSCVFVRFIEDNGLIPRPWLAGPTGSENNRLALARDRHEGYFRARPHDNDRDYLLACFREVGQLPGLEDLFDERHNPVFRLGCSGDAAMALMAFWQKVDPDTGLLVHDFTDAGWNTRFLGDLYQDLSEATRKRYALLQTPEFVEEFILDRTLTPALDTFGYQTVRLIDPTCGSGHFLLGAFARLLALWAHNEPARNPRDTVQRALDGVYGVDLNPFAVAIARFRLLVAALAACDIHALSDAPNFQLHLAVGDSLLHGDRFGLTITKDLFGGEDYKGSRLEHAYAIEDLAQVNAILGQRYHAVVGNPPYITVKDAALNAAYRARYNSCHRQYSLGVPFTERFFELAFPVKSYDPAGFVGLITANSFMKKQFGKKLIEETLPGLDITHIIDTSDAHIPGNGTPSVILFGRDQPPVSDKIRVVMGIKGEPTTPADPAQGLVWQAIADQVDLADSQSVFVSVSDTPRAYFDKHPWSIGGGGAADLKQMIGQVCPESLNSIGADSGFLTITGEDDCLLLPSDLPKRVVGLTTRSVGHGEVVREWHCLANQVILWPYTPSGADGDEKTQEYHQHFLWSYRTSLKNRRAFGVPVEQKGLRWWDIREIYRNRLRTPLTITFAEVTTHNHFILDRGGRVFTQTAPVIKLKAGASEDDHLSILGVLNSSTACFWMKQVCYPKKGSGMGRGIQPEHWMDRYAFAATSLEEFPLTEGKPLDLAQTLDRLAQDYAACLPAALIGSASTPAPEMAHAKAPRRQEEQEG
ncbi:BREX-2 system adenine-specific DNA-methyltransferase PglX [uncultured Thiodictyon sp.]|uniref:BREX-2 system adenine-specific DNA-methyltransferase PglX n=1 Tax=uncultured Thiodictyon sp. TaxID=1846217 RepID=UPI0025F6E017|nr:BREX-2 system adenine-specific DNA-methyltransferase PglX [uncultured Thiodictyon sp.]